MKLHICVPGRKLSIQITCLIENFKNESSRSWNASYRHTMWPFLCFLPHLLDLTITYELAIADALIKLGTSPVYHMREVDQNNHQDLWVEALEAKFESKGTPWSTQEDFDRVLKGFEVCRYNLYLDLLGLSYFRAYRTILLQYFQKS
jgi:hypothetical protein